MIRMFIVVPVKAIYYITIYGLNWYPTIYSYTRVKMENGHFGVNVGNFHIENYRKR